ncbi:MAG TPA: hypothetical protein DDZ51_03295 [Planctomycetaceae bacterium]|nr:hypothetical protein [Planctomycetaceae bacterium]
MSDPVLYDSKCYVSVWQLDSVKQLNEYLEAQYVVGFSKPPAVLETKSRHIVLDTSKDSEFVLSGKRYSWIPGGARAGYLMLWSFGDQTKIGLLDQSRIKPRFGEPDLLSIDAYIRRSKGIQQETEMK